MCNTNTIQVKYKYIMKQTYKYNACTRNTEAVKVSLNAMYASQVEKKPGINSLNICDTTQKKENLGLSSTIFSTRHKNACNPMQYNFLASEKRNQQQTVQMWKGQLLNLSRLSLSGISPLNLCPNCMAIRAGPQSKKWSDQQITLNPTGSIHKKARKKKFDPKKVDFD